MDHDQLLKNIFSFGAVNINAGNAAHRAITSKLVERILDVTELNWEIFYALGNLKWLWLGTGWIWASRAGKRL